MDNLFNLRCCGSSAQRINRTLPEGWALAGTSTCGAGWPIVHLPTGTPLDEAERVMVELLTSGQNCTNGYGAVLYIGHYGEVLRLDRETGEIKVYSAPYPSPREVLRRFYGYA